MRSPIYRVLTLLYETRRLEACWREHFERQLVCIRYPRERFRSRDTRYIYLLYRSSKPKRAKLNNQINQINHFKQRMLNYGSHSDHYYSLTTKHDHSTISDNEQLTFGLKKRLQRHPRAVYPTPYIKPSYSYPDFFAENNFLKHMALTRLVGWQLNMQSKTRLHQTPHTLQTSGRSRLKH
jgi:hypothetical protein